MTRTERITLGVLIFALISFTVLFNIYSNNHNIKRLEETIRKIAVDEAKKEIQKYDSTVTIKNQMQYDTIINKLTEIKTQMKWK